VGAEVSDALDAATIAEGLAAQGESLEVQVLERCTSTNAGLLAGEPGRSPALLVANEQTAGRGRRGRRWHASPGDALMFSLRWQFEGDAGRLRGLSLAAGVSIASTLRELGARGVALKWPNDLLASMALSANSDAAKLGGILIETRARSGHIAAVIGVGLNCRRNATLESRLKRKVAALEDSIDPLPSRNELAVRIVAGLAQALRRFGDAGFEAFRSEWVAMHALEGSPMRVRTSDGRIVAGIAEGIAADGGLLLRNRRGVHCIHSGTVVREGPAAGAAGGAAQ
jgi:BirA family biotin operon repressor/biotin-[acetyl-CoA-carboxylase] ligase